MEHRVGRNSEAYSANQVARRSLNSSTARHSCQGEAHAWKRAQREKWKTACLRHLSTFVEFGEPDPHLFRTLVDNWYAYEIGGPLLNKNGRPKWFNNPDPVKERCALLAMHFVSKAARERIDAGESGLVKDHSTIKDSTRENLHS